MKKGILFIFGLALALGPAGCADTQSHSKGVVLLLDTSGTYRAELEKARVVLNYLLGTLEPGDSLAVARIDTGSFSEKDMITRTTFDRRPSLSNSQKRVVRDQWMRFTSSTKPSPYTDITGGLLQAAEYLTETRAGKKYILIFSDLKEDLAKGYVRNFPLQMKGIHVVALNVTKLRSDNKDPRGYLTRLDTWKKRVERGGGTWQVINDLERLELLFRS